MIICKKCVMNDTVKEFKINKEGICNFCEDWEIKKNFFLNFSQSQVDQNLRNIKNKLNLNKKNMIVLLD